ncbi:MAG: hypothetical protein K8T25_20445 [Planctomycetia bacterium]|nr:hypothetical protein [Planctomycetia bacterium]
MDTTAWIKESLVWVLYLGLPVVAIFVQAMFLKIACRIFNLYLNEWKIEGKVSEPDWFRAVITVLSMMAANLWVVAIAFIVIPSSTEIAPLQWERQLTAVVAKISAALLSLLISGAVLARMLPTTLRRGLGVLILHLLLLGSFVVLIALLLPALQWSM